MRKRCTQVPLLTLLGRFVSIRCNLLPRPIYPYSIIFGAYPTCWDHNLASEFSFSLQISRSAFGVKIIDGYSTSYQQYVVYLVWELLQIMCKQSRMQQLVFPAIKGPLVPGVLWTAGVGNIVAMLLVKLAMKVCNRCKCLLLTNSLVTRG